MSKQNNGFTLGEVMLSISILGILLIGIRGSFGVIRLADSQNCLSASNASISLVKQLASTTSGQPWGVKFEANKATVFKGADYASRSQGSERTLTYSGTCQISGNDQYIFRYENGIVATPGNTTINADSYSETLNLNELGQRY